MERRDENNYIVLPIDVNQESYKYETALIVIYLYYEDMIDEYIPYINNIVDFDGVDVVVITSNNNVYNRMFDLIGEKINILKKPNRGRDVAALLVTAKKYINEYEVICFLHDKKPVFEKFVDDVKLWNRNLWENTIGSRSYINRIRCYLSKNPKCGLIVPPEPFGDYYTQWFKNDWMNNYDVTKELAKMIGLKLELDSNQSSVALGTVFWAKTKALKKLLTYPWKYDDFPEEPMAIDGTISHAIERILPYVAEDAGYDTKTVMSDRFCHTLLSFLQHNAKQAFDTMRSCLEIQNVKDMWKMYEYKKMLPTLFEQYIQVYLYGAGKAGRACLWMLRSLGFEPVGFIVSGTNKNKCVDGLPVYNFLEVKRDLKNSCVIITVVKDEFKTEILRNVSTEEIGKIIIWHQQ